MSQGDPKALTHVIGRYNGLRQRVEECNAQIDTLPLSTEEKSRFEMSFYNYTNQLKKNFNFQEAAEQFERGLTSSFPLRLLSQIEAGIADFEQTCSKYQNEDGRKEVRMESAQKISYGIEDDLNNKRKQIEIMNIQSERIISEELQPSFQKINKLFSELGKA